MNNKKDIKEAKNSVKKLEKSDEWIEKFSDCLIDASNWRAFLDCLKEKAAKKI